MRRLALSVFLSGPYRLHVCARIYFVGLPFGHTGHVRFLTCVESPPPPPPSLPSGAGSDHSSSPGSNPSSWKASPALCANMLVISGGDGYEDFRSATASSADVAGRDDSTNHLLLWRFWGFGWLAGAPSAGTDVIAVLPTPRGPPF